MRAIAIVWVTIIYLNAGLFSFLTKKICLPAPTDPNVEIKQYFGDKDIKDKIEVFDEEINKVIAIENKQLQQKITSYEILLKQKKVIKRGLMRAKLKNKRLKRERQRQQHKQEIQFSIMTTHLDVNKLFNMRLTMGGFFIFDLCLSPWGNNPMNSAKKDVNNYIKLVKNILNRRLKVQQAILDIRLEIKKMAIEAVELEKENSILSKKINLEHDKVNRIEINQML